MKDGKETRLINGLSQFSTPENFTWRYQKCKINIAETSKISVNNLSIEYNLLSRLYNVKVLRHSYTSNRNGTVLMRILRRPRNFIYKAIQHVLMIRLAASPTCKVTEVHA